MMMITKKQADDLRRLIEDYAEAFSSNPSEAKREREALDAKIDEMTAA